MERQETLFYILRYFSDPVRDEAINIGIILLPLSKDSPRTPLVRITKNWRRVLCHDPDADTLMLEGMESTIRELLEEAGNAARQAIERLMDTFSNSLRIARGNHSSEMIATDGKGFLADGLEEALDILMALYVEDHPPVEEN